jgi:hypothetical protein
LWENASPHARFKKSAVQRWTIKPVNPMPQQRKTTEQREDRKGKRVVAAYFEPDAFREIKIFGVEQNKTIDLLEHEAFAALFEKCNRPVPRTILRKLKAHQNG